MPLNSYAYLVKKYYYLVVKTASRLSSDGLERQKLIDVGYKGFLQGINRYKLENGSFINFVIPYIFAAMYQNVNKRAQLLISGYSQNAADFALLEKLLTNRSVLKEAVVNFVMEGAYYNK